MFVMSLFGTAVAAASTWSQASEIAPPASSVGGVNFQSLACSGAGSCLAVGSYYGDAPVYGPYAMAASENGGAWGQANGAVTLPANAANSARFAVNSVACASGSCFAVGSYAAPGFYTTTNSKKEPVLVPRLDKEAMVVSEIGGLWTQAAEIMPPANAANESGAESDSDPTASLTSVSCSAAGSCAASGYYDDSSGHRDPMVVSETGGGWSQASEVTPPANAATPGEPSVASIACSNSGACFAVGTYVKLDEYTVTNAKNELEKRFQLDQTAMAVNESGGVWAPATEVAPPANVNVGNVRLKSVACPASGPCFAVGSYTADDKLSFFNSKDELIVVSQADGQPMVVSETGGVWGQASELALPPNAASTPPPPKPRQRPTGPGNPEGSLKSVACSASGSCVAVGSYTAIDYRKIINSEEEEELVPEFDVHPMVATETNEAWDQASEVTLPAGAVSTPQPNPEEPYLESVSCPPAGSCAAIGYYFDGSRNRHAMVVNETGPGVWGQATAVALPANAASSPGAYLTSLACPESGSCAAIGWYDEITPSELRHENRVEEPIEQAMVVGEGTGGGGAIVAPPPPANVGGSANEATSGSGATTEVTAGTTKVTAAATASVVTSAQLAELLSSELTPSGKGAKIAALLKTSTFALSFKALEPGAAVINWYQVPPGAELARMTKAKSGKSKVRPVPVATGKWSFSAASTATITMRLTAAGKALLKRSKQLQLTAQSTFNPVGGTPVTVTRPFLLKR